MSRLETKNYTTILTEKQQKYQHYHLEKLINMNILQRRVIEQAKFTYSPLGKAFEKQTKTTEEEGKKQDEALEVLKPEENKEEIKSIEGHFPKGIRTNEIKNETDEIKKWEEKIRRKVLVYSK